MTSTSKHTLAPITLLSTAERRLEASPGPLYPILPMETRSLDLNAQEVNFLIDLMMDADIKLTTRLSKLNQMDDVHVMYQLENCLKSFDSDD